MTETTPSTSSMLTIMGILRDSLDDICKTGERTFSILEEYEQKMKPFENMKQDEQEIKEILTALPPEKAAALIAAITDADKLVQSLPSEDAKKQLDKVKKSMVSLQEIRNNLHKALDGVVP